MTIVKKQKLNNIEDLYASIGYGGIILSRILPRIKDEYYKLKTNIEQAEKNEKEEKVQPAKKKEPKPKPYNRTKESSGIVIEGIDNCLMKLSKCCNPLPYDEIVGFITRGSGVSIHKKNCFNVPEDINNCDQSDRWIKAHWQGETLENFKTTLEIIADDRPGLLADVTLQLYVMKIYIHKLNSKENGLGGAIIQANVTVDSMEYLDTVISNLKKINKVISVRRV